MTRALLLCLALAGCGALPGGPAGDGVFAPGVAPGAEEADPAAAAARLMEAGEVELALDAYVRAAARDGLSAEILAGLGTANLRLGRLGQAEVLLREAVEKEPAFVPAWNNLGVLLMEQGHYGEAALTFQRAYAEDSGASDTIRDNLRLALARRDDPAYTGVNEAEEVRLMGYGAETARPSELAVEPL